MNSGTVVRQIVTLDEQSFHDRLVAGWARGIARLGKAKWAHKVGMSPRGVDKVLAGSTPHAHTILNSRAADTTALDELFAGYGVRLVPAEASCSSDEGAGLCLLRAAMKCCEAEADGVKNHAELFAMEPELRESAAKIAAMLARIDALRGGTGGS
jgi:hypothetical protein